MSKLKLTHLLSFLLLWVITISAETTPCDYRETPKGGVCVCTADHCDYLDNPQPESEEHFTLVSSSKAGHRFHTSAGQFNADAKHSVLDYAQAANETSEDSERATRRKVQLKVDREKKYRKIVGFGGSFTGSVSYLLDLLPQELQDHLYKSYYAADGIAGNLMRMSIGGCDFDWAPWAYNEQPEDDLLLSNFTQLDDRDLKKVQQIKRLKEVSNLDELLIKGAAWSSPRWMKTNKRWTGFGQLRKKYYQTWADYHLRWLELMEANGLPIWAISTGNEPTNGIAFMYFVKFMSLGWQPHSQAIWLNDYLGPTIRHSKYKDIIIFGNDDQRHTFPHWFNMMKFFRPTSVDYLNAFSVHWYWDEIFSPTFMESTIANNPDKFLLVTESCIGDKPWQKAGPVLGSWHRGEKYARDFLQTLKYGYNGWIDWNLIVDEVGGPNYVNNTVDAAVIVDTKNPTEILKQPMFYAMGHFWKFLPKDSVRIDAIRSNVNVDSVAYLRPDGTVAAVLLNTGNVNVEVTVEDSVRGNVVLDLPPRSFHTLVYH